MSQPYVNSYIYSWFESHGISITSKTCMINGSGGPPVANIAVGALTVISTVYHGNFDPPAEPSSRHSQFQPPDATHSLQMPTEPEKSTTSAEPDTRPQPAPTIIGGVPVIVIPTKSAVVVGTQTLDPGEGTFYSGTLVSLLPSEVVVGTDTYSLPASPATSKPSVLSMAGNEITADTNGAFIVGSQTLAPGMGKVTIDGSTFEIVSTGGAVIVDGETRTLAPAAESTDVGRSSSSNAILTGTAAETKAKAIWILGIILMVQIYGLVI